MFRENKIPIKCCMHVKIFESVVCFYKMTTLPVGNRICLRFNVVASTYIFQFSLSLHTTRKLTNLLHAIFFFSTKYSHQEILIAKISSKLYLWCLNVAKLVFDSLPAQTKQER